MTIRQGKIVAIGGSSGGPADLDLDDAVLLPGLINAHTHLEFSDLTAPLAAGASFPDWISQVVAHRRQTQQDLTSDQLLTAHRAAIQLGLQEAFYHGTCAAADIVTPPWSPQSLPNEWPVDEHLPRHWRQHLADAQRPGVLAMPELIGLSADRLQGSLTWAQALLDADPLPSILLDLGLSPHAPYSVLFEQLLSFQGLRQTNRVVAAHVAESPAELEWLEQGQGAFRSSFERLGIQPPETRPSIQDFIQLLSKFSHGLLIHGNYLNRSRAEQVAESPSISIVYCPRTHVHFGHAPYPWEMFRQLGIPVVLGTDSRASNPDLQLWREVVQARQAHPDVSPEMALAAVTNNSARALNLDARVGTLAVGKTAFINVCDADSSWTVDNLLEEMTSRDITVRPLAVRCSIPPADGNFEPPQTG